MEKKNGKAVKQDETAELTPDRMEKVNGGFRRYDECSKSPDKKHHWEYTDTKTYCRYCKQAPR
ncbi:MAG: hypothetical protein IKG23_04570 [Clostridia bacterium]|nr:hypothetical protein [Clostridia bacterium]